MKKLNLTAEPCDEGERLDKFISDNSDISRSFAAKLCEDGSVSVSGKAIRKNYKLKGYEEIEILVPEAAEPTAEAEDIPLDIVYEDSDVIVVNKPQGMVVHPAAGNYSGTLVNALMFHCGGELSAINGVIRPGIVHRIDKDTSGLLVAAKNNEAHLKLSAQLKERKALRKYAALVNGNIKEDEGTINKPIGRSSSDRKKMAIKADGREAITHFKVMERFGAYTLLECVLETGRTHQIRVHMAYLGHPLACDDVYGKPRNTEEQRLCGQCLHAGLIGFIHPRSGEYVEFSTELPEYFTRFMKGL